MLVYARRCLTLLLPLALSAPAFAQWTSVGDGIEYREYTISGPNNLFVARLDRGNQNAIIDSTIGQGRLTGGTERMTLQASRYDDAINWWGQAWGQRNDVVVAINGSYYNTSTGVPTSGVIQTGWYAKRYDNVTGESGFVWQLDRDAYIGDCVTHTPSKQVVTYIASGNTQEFKGINVARGSSDFIIYTHQYDSDTKTDNTGVEVLVELPRPLLLIAVPNMVTGTVRQIRQNQGSTPIPFDHVVLSATGSNATTLLNNAHVGDQIGISQEIRSFIGNCTTSGSLDWTKSYGAVSGNWVFLENNIIQFGIDSSGARHPRTAIAYNDSYVFFVVCDGRAPNVSIGMTIDELATFCKNTLGATWGLNQDGGGSSTMVVNGTIKNDPSDGTERSVSNGMLMLNLAPKMQSGVFAATNTIRTTTSTSVRLGPGSHFASIATLPGSTQGTVLDHTLGGIYAKGQYWWKCDFGGTVGWAQQSALTLVSGGQAPTITQHPAGVAVGPGQNAVFSIQAQGTAPLSYRWQKNQSELSDGGQYSGVLTATLTITGVGSADAGAYRCRVTNTYGSATSNEATLNVQSADFDGDGDIDLADWSHLQLCLGIVGVSQVPECIDTDLDTDEIINLLDVNEFLGCLSGPSIAPPPGC